MKRVLAAAVAAVLISAVGFAKESNEQQIRARIDAFADAWNKHDTVAMTAFWSFNGDLLNPVGRRAKGMTEIQKLFQEEHSAVMKQSTYKTNSTSIRFIEPELAFADSDAEISGVASPDGTTATIKPHVVTLWRNSGGQWWIVAARAYNYTPPPPPPAPPAPPVPK
jgi:uncharacterized protein (TIGR02246 family)